MNSPILKTLLIAIVAMATTATAAVYYPWPEPVVESDSTGDPLFESYAAGAVRSIRIEKFDADHGVLDLIQLERKGEKWVLPTQENFLATNSFQITLATNSLNDKTILEERADQIQDHVKYGVVDPSDYANTASQSALGMKIVLEGRSRKELASLIIGKPVGTASGRSADPMAMGKYFVRIPGQPNVYVIDFQPAALRTDFKDWVDSNLFQFDGVIQINRLKVEDYRVDFSTPNLAARQDNHRILFSAGEAPLVEVLDGETWKPVIQTPEIESRLPGILRQMQMIVIEDVVRKSPPLAKLFRSPVSTATDADFDSLKEYGFAISGFGNSNYDFDSAGGELIIEFGDGVSVSLYFGAVVEDSGSTESEGSRFAIMSAGVNEELFPAPPKPLANDDPAETEAQQKAYLRLVEEREEDLRLAHQRASALNQRHGDWIYVVSRELVDRLRPDLDVSLASISPAVVPDVAVPAEATSGDSKSAESKPEASKPATPGDADGKKPVEAKPKPKSPKNDPFG